MPNLDLQANVALVNDPAKLALRFANDPKLREHLLDYLGRPPHPSGADQAIWHASQLGHSFEWHPQTRKLYRVVPKDGGGASGELVAEGIETHGDAHNAVNIWVRGWHEGKSSSEAPKTGG